MLTSCCYLFTCAQTRFKGFVKNENGRLLPKVHISGDKGAALDYTDSLGRFELIVVNSKDTVSFTLEGYQPLRVILRYSENNQIVLKKNLPGKKTLNSFISKEHSRDAIELYGGETYSSLIENPAVSTEQFKSVSFAVNTNRASYSNVRRFINMESRVPSDAVRIEEMLNYFNFNYADPIDKDIFKTSSVIATCPWNENHNLLFLSVATKTLDLAKVPPCNFVFLIDISGSMDLPNKLPLIKSGLRLLVKNLRKIDSVSIIGYGKSINVIVESVPGSKKDSLIRVIESLNAEGGTPGEAGLRLAYKVAKRRFITGGNNRIILATDGDFNVGASSEKELEKLIEQEGATGIQLVCLGVGMGNYKDSKLYLMAQKGHGNFAYLDNEAEAQKVLVSDFSQTLFTVAENVYFTITFDSSVVKEFRLIGYDNKRSALEDSYNQLEGGEIGPGQSLSAVFEIATDESIKSSQILATLTIHYQLPTSATNQFWRYVCSYNQTSYHNLDAGIKKAMNVAMLGMKLKNSSYAKEITWSYIEKNAKQVFNSKTAIDKQYLELVAKARKIYKKKEED